MSGPNVLICMNCGCGFLKLPKDDNGETCPVHHGPLWGTVHGPISKDGCWGAIEAIPRAIAIIRANDQGDPDEPAS